MTLQSIFSPSTPNFHPKNPSFFTPTHNFLPFTQFKTTKIKPNKSIIITCSIPQTYKLGKTNNNSNNDNKKQGVRWNNIYKRISNIKMDPQKEINSILTYYEKNGKLLTRWELSRVIKELRKFRCYTIALEVYGWMNNKMERFKMTSSDTAVQLDLIAKAHGITKAEDYFKNIPEKVRDKRIYGALLNAYVGAKIKDKAETLMDEMRNKGFALHPLPYNVMMTLYMKLEEFDRVDGIVSELKEKRIPMDPYTYNIWLAACGSRGSAEAMEQVYEQMDLDPTIVPNWSTFSTMAAMYVKLGLLDKAEQALKNLETRIPGQDRTAYHYLISLYGGLGNKDEVLRVWNIYKSLFPSIPNWGYHAVISSLVRSNDLEGAEKLYEEWLTVKSSYDPKIGNLLMGWYVKGEPFEKVKSFFDSMIDAGGKPNAASWEILGSSYVKERKISEAFDCFKESTSAEGSKNWKPKPSNVDAFLELCDQEANQGIKEDFRALLTKMDSVQDGEVETKNPENRDEETDSKDPEMLISVIE